METVIRITIIYLFVMGGLRILGKREFGQLTPVELVSLLLVPEIFTNALMPENRSIVNGMVGVATLFTLVFLTSVLTHLSKRAEVAISAQPTILVHHGKLLEDHMNKERVTPDEIFSAMHESGLEKLSEVEWAILDSDGKISIVPVKALRGGGRQDQSSVPGA